MTGGGRLRTYLGTAPGVGKTVAMLAEGRQRAGNGERVMAGWIEWHGRPEMRRQLGGLEMIAPRTVARLPSGNRAPDLHFLVAGAGFEPATSGL